MKYLKLAVIAAVFISFIAVMPVEAQGVWDACGTDNPSPVCANDTAPSILGVIVDTLLYFVGALSIIFIIWSGFKYITSGGNPETVKSAKNTLLYAVIGLAVSVLSFSIVNFVIETVDLPQSLAECTKINMDTPEGKAKRKRCQQHFNDGNTDAFTDQ